MLTKIFSSNLPSQPIVSSGREIVIHFKSHIRKEPMYIRNGEAKFLINYESMENGKISFNILMINFENGDVFYVL